MNNLKFYRIIVIYVSGVIPKSLALIVSLASTTQSVHKVNADIKNLFMGVELA